MSMSPQSGGFHKWTGGGPFGAAVLSAPARPSSPATCPSFAIVGLKPILNDIRSRDRDGARPARRRENCVSSWRTRRNQVYKTGAYGPEWGVAVSRRSRHLACYVYEGRPEFNEEQVHGNGQRRKPRKTRRHDRAGGRIDRRPCAGRQGRDRGGDLRPGKGGRAGADHGAVGRPCAAGGGARARQD